MISVCDLLLWRNPFRPTFATSCACEVTDLHFNRSYTQINRKQLLRAPRNLLRKKFKSVRKANVKLVEITASKLLRTVLVLVSTNPLANRSQTVLKLVSLVSNLHRRTLLKPTRETLLLNSRRTVLKLVHRLPSANRRRTQLKLVSQKLGKRRKNVHKLVKLPLSNPLQTLPRNLLKPILSHRSYRRRTLP